MKEIPDHEVEYLRVKQENELERQKRLNEQRAEMAYRMKQVIVASPLNSQENLKKVFKP